MLGKLLKSLVAIVAIALILVGTIAPAHASDIRNVLIVKNQSSYRAVVTDKEDKLGNFPDNRVTVDAGDQKTTGGMWTPWCDSQKDLGEDHYINIVLNKTSKPEKKFQLFQHKDPVWFTYDLTYDLKKEISGDSSAGKGEYTLIIDEPSPDQFVFSYDKQ